MILFIKGIQYRYLYYLFNKCIINQSVIGKSANKTAVTHNYPNHAGK